MKRLAIITTHPIQYNAPMFALLAGRKRIDIKVFYTWGQEVLAKKFDPGFGKDVAWDIPLLDGYDYQFVNNIAKYPGSHHFKGIDNPTLVNEIEAWQADAILVYGWNFKAHLKALRYFHKKIPVYFRGDSTLIGQPGIVKRLLRKIVLNRVYSLVDIAFYVGTNNKAYYKYFGLKEQQLVFAPHAIDNNRFANISADEAEEVLKLKQEIGIEVYRAVFLYVGKLEEKKNVAMLLEAFCSIKDPGLGLLIVGNGPLEDAYKSRFKHIENIHFLDFQNQSVMPLIYRLGNVLVVPSTGATETWGLVINEAMACGLPVLASDACGAAIDLVKTGETGYVFSGADQRDLQDKMEKMVSGKISISQMRAKSTQLIQDWNFERSCQQIEMVVLRQKNE